MRSFFVSIILLGSATQAVAQDAFNDLTGYFDLGLGYTQNSAYFNDIKVGSSDEWSGTATAVMQYRFDRCAVGMLASAKNDAESVETNSYFAPTYDIDRKILTIAGQAGCEVHDFWIVAFGLLGTNSGESSIGGNWSTDRNAWGGGIDYRFSPDLSLGLMVMRDDYDFSGDTLETMLYGAKVDYFFHENMMLSTRLNLRNDDFDRTFEASSTLFYKPEDWRVALYGGVTGSFQSAKSWTLMPGDEAHTTSIGAVAGLRFFFDDHTLRAQHNNTMPVF